MVVLKMSVVVALIAHRGRDTPELGIRRGVVGLAMDEGVNFLRSALLHKCRSPTRKQRGAQKDGSFRPAAHRGRRELHAVGRGVGGRDARAVPRVKSDCHFPVQFNHFIAVLLSY